MARADRYGVVIIGVSIVGCAAAVLYADVEPQLPWWSDVLM